MKRFFIAVCIGLLSLGLAVQDAEAKRLGGGMSRGMQRSTVPQRQTTPPPSVPSQQVAPQVPTSPSPTAPAPRRSWLGPLAGLAAGIGLAALLSHFGLGEGMANLVMILLLSMAAVALIRLFFRRPAPRPRSEPMHYAGVGGPHLSPVPTGVAEPAAGEGGGYRNASSTSRNIPAGFDVEGFLRIAKVNFIRLQAANDAGNLADIREFTTPEMFAETKVDIDDRRGAPQRTDVLTLDAELLEVVSEPGRHVASVRFRGMIREEAEGTPQPFDEVWNLIKPADGGGGWVLAGIQQLN